MAKKNVKNNRNLMIAGGVVVAVVIVYLISSYNGLVGTKSFTGSDGKVSTKLSCSVASDNTVSAVLTVADASSNSLALPQGSTLKGETINWAAPSSAGAMFPLSSVTDAQGMTQSKFSPTTSAASSATASFNGDTLTVESKASDGSSTFTTVAYDVATCEVPVSGK